MNNTARRFSEWRLPVINRIIRAEFLNTMLVFTLIDRNSDRADEIGYWDADGRSWFFVARYKTHEEYLRRRNHRIMHIIMRRYSSRITRLQTELVKSK